MLDSSASPGGLEFSLFLRVGEENGLLYCGGAKREPARANAYSWYCSTLKVRLTMEVIREMVVTGIKGLKDSTVPQTKCRQESAGGSSMSNHKGTKRLQFKLIKSDSVREDLPAATSSSDPKGTAMPQAKPYE